jgi:hypothetical protein
MASDHKPQTLVAVRAELGVHEDPEGISVHVWLGHEIEVCIKGRLPSFSEAGEHDHERLLDEAAALLHDLGYRASMPHAEGRRRLTSAEGHERSGYGKGRQR